MIRAKDHRRHQQVLLVHGHHPPPTLYLLANWGEWLQEVEVEARGHHQQVPPVHDHHPPQPTPSQHANRRRS
jgi:hypothetical protein